jgi:hypothetical protein
LLVMHYLKTASFTPTVYNVDFAGSDHKSIEKILQLSFSLCAAGTVNGLMCKTGNIARAKTTYAYMIKCFYLFLV